MTASPAELRELARRLRISSIEMISRAGTSHVGSCLSAAEIMAVLYGAVARLDPKRPDWPDRDRVIVSKGHAAAVTYAALAERGLLAPAALETFALDGAGLFGHVTRADLQGVELSTGSLGHGLPVGCGMALSAKRDGLNWRTFVVMSDGECDEGTTWESALFAAHHGLDNLVAIIDYNGIQSLDTVESTLRLEPFAAKLAAFGWAVRDVDGHNVEDLLAALSQTPLEPGRPSAVVARTVKGKGVSFMEDKVLWHYRAPRGEELAAALAELEDHA